MLSSGQGHANLSPSSKLTPLHAQLPLTYGQGLQIHPSILPYFCTFSQTPCSFAARYGLEWQRHKCCSLLCVQGVPGVRLLRFWAMICAFGNYASISLFLFLCCGYQILSEASPVNIVLKLNQLISLLSSIEEKVEF